MLCGVIRRILGSPKRRRDRVEVELIVEAPAFSTMLVPTYRTKSQPCAVRMEQNSRILLLIHAMFVGNAGSRGKSKRLPTCRCLRRFVENFLLFWRRAVGRMRMLRSVEIAVGRRKGCGWEMCGWWRLRGKERWGYN